MFYESVPIQIRCRYEYWDKITHMAVKIAVTLEYEDEKKTVSLKQVTFAFVAKKLTALSDIFFNFWKLCTWLLSMIQPRIQIFVNSCQSVGFGALVE